MKQAHPYSLKESLATIAAAKEDLRSEQVARIKLQEASARFSDRQRLVREALNRVQHCRPSTEESRSAFTRREGELFFSAGQAIVKFGWGDFVSAVQMSTQPISLILRELFLVSMNGISQEEFIDRFEMEMLEVCAESYCRSEVEFFFDGLQASMNSAQLESVFAEDPDFRLARESWRQLERPVAPNAVSIRGDGQSKSAHEEVPRTWSASAQWLVTFSGFLGAMERRGSPWVGRVKRAAPPTWKAPKASLYRVIDLVTAIEQASGPNLLKVSFPRALEKKLKPPNFVPSWAPRATVHPPEYKLVPR